LSNDGVDHTVFKHPYYCVNLSWYIFCQWLYGW